ncbi:MAG: InlB B-repeat-containing protein, partial [Lachnospiraceae bacterium]|nr:InlB B-repeat-containing protein [Lachnospiraceae bacterium]
MTDSSHNIITVSYAGDTVPGNNLNNLKGKQVKHVNNDGDFIDLTTGTGGAKILVTYQINGVEVKTESYSDIFSVRCSPLVPGDGSLSSYNSDYLEDGYWTVLSAANNGADGIAFVLNATGKTYNIQYYLNGNEITGDELEGNPTTYQYGTGVAEGRFKDLSKSGFDGWYSNPECTGDKVRSIGKTSTDGNLQLYAKAEETPAVKCTVTFNANGGTGQMDPQSADNGTSAALKKNTFTREGYSFKEWNTEADGSGSSYADQADYTFNADVTLYAQWTKGGSPDPKPEPKPEP